MENQENITITIYNEDKVKFEEYYNHIINMISEHRGGRENEIKRRKIISILRAGAKYRLKNRANLDYEQIIEICDMLDSDENKKLNNP